MNRSCITQRGLVLLLVVSTSCPALYAGFRPEQQVITTEADGASCLYAADLDGDGDLDVLSASEGDGKIAWYANDGSSHFGPQQVITTEAVGANCVHAADLDGDGDMDVLSVSPGDGKIAWYANDGLGHFGAQQVIATVASGASVYAADLDGDGDVDVLLSASSLLWENKIAWYANDGSGHFGSQQVIDTAAGPPGSVYAADLDGDGDMDVLSASACPGYCLHGAGPRIAWYKNDGSGQFGSEQVIGGYLGATSMHTADLDGDGDIDVLWASYSLDGGDRIAWYANDGSGQFGSEQVITTKAYHPQSVYAADLDGDGDMDVLSASPGDDKIAWYANDGSGHFGSQQVITTNSASLAYPADLDGDGDLDVLSAGGSTIAWHANDGSGHFGSQQVITTEAAGARSVYAADLDGDGDLDVLSASSWDKDNKIAWYANDGSGQFGPQQVISTAADGPWSVYAADLDGDGDMDVLSASSNDDKIAWYANDGSGHFGPQQVITRAVEWAAFVYAADLDGDGDLDVLSASNSADGKVAWYANDGSGHFGPQQAITTEAQRGYCVHVADLDGDGDLDVLSASAVDDKIAWYANDGSGRFAPKQVLGTEVQLGYWPCPADLDGDGDLDVLSPVAVWGENWDEDYGGWIPMQIAWYANDGSGQFGSQQVIITETGEAGLVYAADLDGDGDLDVLSASSRDSKIAWYANDGSGHFGSRQMIGTMAWVYGAARLCVADLDGDGDMDVLSASYYWDNKIAWYANDGTGLFGPQQVISTAAVGASSVYAADLDGDGDLDVLSASVVDDKIAWYENE